MDFNTGLNGWNMLFTAACVIGVTLSVLSFIRRDMLLKIQSISAQAVATIVKDKESIDVLSMRLDGAEREVAELRVRVARLERIEAGIGGAGVSGDPF